MTQIVLILPKNALRKLQSVVTGDIKALKSIWIIGDSFLNDSYGTFIDICNKDCVHKRAFLYIAETYNLRSMSTIKDSFSKNVLANIVNALYKGLNDLIYLPHFIIVAPDGHIAVP